MNARLLALGAPLAGCLLSACLLSGCSGEESGSDGPEVAGTVGDADSDCPLPVTFDRAMGWEPQVPAPVDDVTDDGLRDVLEAVVSPGPFELACEIKSPSNLGLLRVYTGPAKLAARDPERLLRTFVQELEGGTDLTFTSTETTSGLAVTDVAYTEVVELLEEERPRRAFLVTGDDVVVVVHVGGLDAEEHEGMLPAYELARDSVHATGPH